jgi:hypothetical protein
MEGQTTQLGEALEPESGDSPSPYIVNSYDK